MKIMLDTNILLATVAFGSKYLEHLINKITDEHTLILCDYVIDEVYGVIKRKKPEKEKEADAFFAVLPFVQVASPKHICEKDRLFQIRDEDDYIILHTAIVEGVDILITGDKDFFEVDVKKPKILSPAEFIQQCAVV
jgi:putative PIN family toxin of toxin-antitoxin system